MPLAARNSPNHKAKHRYGVTLWNVRQRLVYMLEWGSVWLCSALSAWRGLGRANRATVCHVTLAPLKLPAEAFVKICFSRSRPSGVLYSGIVFGQG